MASSMLTGSMTIRSLLGAVQLARVCIRTSLYNGCFREARAAREKTFYCARGISIGAAVRFLRDSRTGERRRDPRARPSCRDDPRRNLREHDRRAGSSRHRADARPGAHGRCPFLRCARDRRGSRLDADLGPRSPRVRVRRGRYGFSQPLPVQRNQAVESGRDAEPLEENLAVLASTVRAVHADLGIAHDGDGDRMVAVDREGRFVGGDTLLALFAREEVRRGLVVPVDASMVLDDLLPKATIWRTRVGDVYVAAELKRRGADFGGEPSGTWIFPKATLCPDGVYAAARLVTMVAARPLDAMVQEVPQYPVLRGSVTYDASKRKTIESRLDVALRALGGHVSTVDGWRLQFDDGWSLVRFSGTEPKIRLTAESRDATRANEIYSAVLSSAKGATE